LEFSGGAMRAGEFALATVPWNAVGRVLSFQGSIEFGLLLLACFLLILSGAGLWAVLPGRWRSKKRSELTDRYRGMIEDTSDIIHIVSPEGKFLYVNRAWRKTFGYTDDDIARLTLMGLLHPEERLKAQSEIGQLMATKNVIEIETRFVTKDGRTIWVEGNSTCEIEHGVVVSRRGIFHNVTERKHGEADRARLLALLEEAPDYIGSSTPEGKVLWINRAFRNLRSLPENYDFSQMRTTDFHPPWANQIILDVLPTVLSAGVWKGETAMLDANGREIPVSQTIVAHRDDKGKVIYLSTLCRDITDSQRAEEALREAHSQINVVLQREKELSRTD
jgi:PAS domain S-box-containing protein